jgi:hypothetical protein
MGQPVGVRDRDAADQGTACRCRRSSRARGASTTRPGRSRTASTGRWGTARSGRRPARGRADAVEDEAPAARVSASGRPGRCSSGRRCRTAGRGSVLSGTRTTETERPFPLARATTGVRRQADGGPEGVTGRRLLAVAVEADHEHVRAPGGPLSVGDGPARAGADGPDGQERRRW